MNIESIRSSTASMWPIFLYYFIGYTIKYPLSGNNVEPCDHVMMMMIKINNNKIINNNNDEK